MRVEIPFAAGKGVVQVSIWVSSKPPGLVLCNVSLHKPQSFAK